MAFCYWESHWHIHWRKVATYIHTFRLTCIRTSGTHQTHTHHRHIYMAHWTPNFQQQQQNTSARGECWSIFGQFSWDFDRALRCLGSIDFYAFYFAHTYTLKHAHIMHIHKSCEASSDTTITAFANDINMLHSFHSTPTSFPPSMWFLLYNVYWVGRTRFSKLYGYQVICCAVRNNMFRCCYMAPT